MAWRAATATRRIAEQPATAAVLAAAVVGGAMAVALGSRRRRVAAASPHPADRTLAGASPAVFGAKPRRRFYAGTDPAQAVTIEDLRAMAHRYLPRFAAEYLEGGAEDEATLARNIAALARWRLAHRSLVDVSRRDVSTTLFDRPMAMPVAIAPTGLNGLFRPHADLYLAEAAAEAGIPFAQSTMSNDRMQRVGRVPRLRYWWQLYVFGPPEVRRTLIRRAQQAGCEALIVTVDAQTYGNREWEKREQSDRGLGWSEKIEALRHPRWFGERMLVHGMPRFRNVAEFIPEDRRGFFASAQWIRSQMDLALTWDKVAQIREQWRGKLLLKGLLEVEDVVRAADNGVDGVVLSNHGGRQLDWAQSPLDVLPAARQAVGRRIVLLADGGIRRGTDIVKALALGADAVLVGRAPLYGVAAAGRAGAARALTILRDELDRDLSLLGVSSVAAISPRLLRPAEPPPPLPAATPLSL